MSYTIPDAFAKAFKPADIRGIYPTEINDAVAYYTAQAFVTEFKYTKVVVGYDMRRSSETLWEAFMEGARDAGCDVVMIGMVATPQLYFASGTLGLPGVMITASHSPKEYNGMKLVHPGAVPVTAETGLSKIKALVAKATPVHVTKRGRLTTKSVFKAYQKQVLKGCRPSQYAGLKLAVDNGNGMAGAIVPLLQEKLPITFDVLFAKFDGNFPNRDSDPNLHENQLALIKKLQSKKYDFGISFDGDADRIAFLDEQGRYINSAIIGALIADRLLKQQPKATIVHTNLTSRVLEETIKAGGGKAVRAKVGHTFLKEKMRQQEAVFGCEHSGHFFWREYFYTDSVVLTLRTVLDAYLEEQARGGSFASMIEPYLRYHQTEDVVIPVVDTRVALQHIKSHLDTLELKQVKAFDGYYIDKGDVWGAIKASVTEQAIKLMFESESKTKAETFQRQLVKYVKSIAKQ